MIGTFDAALDADWNPGVRYYETPKTLLEAFSDNERVMMRHWEICRQPLMRHKRAAE